MRKPKIIPIHFPLGGIDKRLAYQERPPYTTPLAKNVRPMDPLEGRARGGSRPMLTKAYHTELGGGEPVKMLSSVTAVRDDGYRYWTDSFSNLDQIDESWETASWIGTDPEILPDVLSNIEDVEEGGLVRKALSDFDNTKRYSFGIYISPWEEAHRGEYRLYGRMDDTTPLVTTDGFVAALALSGTTGVFSGTLKTYLGTVNSNTYSFSVISSPTGLSEGGWFFAVVNGSTVTVSWQGIELISQDIVGDINATGNHRVGFGMLADTVTTEDEVCIIEAFHYNYYSTSTHEAYRKHLVAVSNGQLYVEDPVGGTLTEADATNPTLASDRVLQAAEWGQKNYIADNSDPKVQNSAGSAVIAATSLSDTAVSDFTDEGIDETTDICFIYDGDATVTDGSYKILRTATGLVTLASDAGTGNCAYRIERAPKVFDIKTNAITIWETDSYGSGAKKGHIPPGCSLICRYHDSIMLAGDRLDPHMWYLMRVSDPDDADYVADPDDPQKASAGTSSEAGVPGEPVTCLAPYKDDYVLMGGTDSLWVMRGLPVYTGSIDNISTVAGVLSANSWCYGPEGELVFLSRDGVYIMGAGADAIPIRFSREKMPRELLNLDPEEVIVSMSYDVRDYGVHLFVTPKDAKGDDFMSHYWLDWTQKSFYEVTMNSDFEPYTSLRYTTDRLEESRVLLGGRDGYLRSFRNSAQTEDRSAMSSEIILGPIPMGGKSNQEGVLNEVFGILDRNSRDVTISVHVGDSAEACRYSTAVKTKDFTSGVNNLFRPERRGAWFMLKISSTKRWAMENIETKFTGAGYL